MKLLEGLCEAGHSPAGVIALKDRPAGRGLKPRMTPLKEAALALGACAVADWEDVSSGAEWAAGLPGGAGLGVVAAFGRILPRDFIERFPRGLLNVHPSLLPQLRGAAPVQRALLEGRRLTGVSLALLDEGVDTGDVVDQAEVEIGEEDDSAGLEDRLAGAALRLLLANLERLEEGGSLEGRPQDHASATYAPPITAADRPIDWSRPGLDIFNQVRALSPRPGALTGFRGRRVKVLKVRPAGVRGGSEPGTLEVTGKDELLVSTSTCSLRIAALQPEGGKVLTAGEFLRGYRPAEGEAFRHG